jgi:hypothetical protein
MVVVLLPRIMKRVASDTNRREDFGKEGEAV